MSKRVVVNQVNKSVVKVDINETVLVPDIQSTMSNAVGVIALEIGRLHAKSKRGVSLDTHESRALREFIQCLVAISKEAREAAKSNDLSSLSNEELLKLAQELNKNKQQTESEENE